MWLPPKRIEICEKKNRAHNAISHLWIYQNPKQISALWQKKMKIDYITTTQFGILLWIVDLIACHLAQIFETNLEFIGDDLKGIDIFRVHANNFLVALTTQYATKTDRIQFIYEFDAAICERCRVIFAALYQHRRRR